MGQIAREIQSVLTRSGVSNITSVTFDGECWSVECGRQNAEQLHVRVGRLRAGGGSAWAVMTALAQVRQPYLATVVGSFELSRGDLAVVSRADAGRSLTEILDWGRQLSLGESVTVLHGVARAMAALRGSVGAIGGISASRCRVLTNGLVQMIDPAAGIVEAAAEDYWRTDDSTLPAEGPVRDTADPLEELHVLATELGHPGLAGLVSEYAPAGCGAIVRALEQRYTAVPLTTTHVPRLPGPRATRQHPAAVVEVVMPVKRRIEMSERW